MRIFFTSLMKNKKQKYRKFKHNFKKPLLLKVAQYLKHFKVSRSNWDKFLNFKFQNL